MRPLKKKDKGRLRKRKQKLRRKREGFNQCLNYIMQNLKNNNPNEAIKCLRGSLKIEAKIKDLFEQMKEIEDDLKLRY